MTWHPPFITYTTAEVAAGLQCSVDLVRDKVAAGIVRPMRLGDGKHAAMRFSPEDVEKLARSLRPPESVRRPRRRRRL